MNQLEILRTEAYLKLCCAMLQNPVIIDSEKKFSTGGKELCKRISEVAETLCEYAYPIDLIIK